MPVPNFSDPHPLVLSPPIGKQKNLKQKWGEDAINIFSLKPSLEHLERRENFGEIVPLLPSYEQTDNRTRRHKLLTQQLRERDCFVLCVCRSKFVTPKLSEGFCEIVNVNFVPKFDKNSQHAVLYRHFLMEK